ncbi:MAG: SDR family NAD(P)-dependent oxidoreductase, partial [Pseudomonadota bacterium]|nr:SDR family NAD(P)-dependent oxidoreductase [Pseudomonadota bacterium]
MTTHTAPVVLITGALAGIGRATALAFARDGARLVVSGRNQEAG